jgi:hypothetical protein
MRIERRLGALLVALTAGALPAHAAAPAAGNAERSLEAITIEGLAKGPEVLFINAREPARVELQQGWRLLAAAGLLELEFPPPATFRAAAPATPDPKLTTDAILNL